MLRLTFKNLVANKLRFALTTFGVILAVSFVVSAFVLGDGLRSTFTGVSEEITAGVDLEVRNVADFGDAPALPADTASVVAGVDGVADAVPSIEAADNAVRPIKANGESIATDGPPQLAFNWIDNDALSAFTLVEGAPPEIGEFTMDVDSAAKHDFVIGDTYAVMVPDGRVDLTLSGTTSFGADNATLGAVLMQMNTDQASELFAVDGIGSVAVQVADGADVAQVRADVQAAVAAVVPTAEVVDHATVLEETTTEFTDEIDLVGNILLGFGGVALFVSIFIIYNTFAIVLGQRTRELALLRTVGADPKQIRRSVLGEALVVGVLASAGGIGGGIAVAKGIEALFLAMGVDLSDYPLILAPRTLIAAVVIGVGVTMVAAIGPARRAATVPPIAALASGADARSIGARKRSVVGFGLFGAGLAAGAAGLAGFGSTSATVAELALGAIGMFLGVTALSPLAVGGVTRVVGWPMRKVAGVAGRLAQQNAARNSRRTATTAAALMIGLALVSTALVVGDSVKATIGSTFDQSAKAEYYLTDDLDEVEFPAPLAGELRGSRVVDAATGFTSFEARVGGTVTDVMGLDFDQIDAVLDVDVRAGGFASDVVNPVVVSVDEADAIGAVVGDVLTVEVANGSRAETTIVGLFHDQTVLTEDYLFDSSVLAATGVPETPVWLAVSIADGASPADVEALVADLSDQFPYASIETAAQFRDRVQGMINDVLIMVNAMVALAIIIALIGIANTLALSVFERTRELGLVRAVGMTRRQLRRMVRLEAALVATFGATLGVGLGLLFGFGVVAALPASFASELSVPIVPIVVMVIVAALAAVAAAWLPARRASRLDVLTAIAV
jgi:putative ABC transport system permease protein